MAKQKYIRTEYNDGNVVLSNIRKGRASIPVIGLNDSYTATKVNTWFDESPMTPEKADGSVYLRLAETGEYFRVNLPNDGELFLEKDTVAQLRGMSAVEILLLKMGYYKGVTLNGYYKANDTPGSIQYYLSDTTEVDDGGSVFEVGGIKLEHEFLGVVDVRYFGAKCDGITDDTISVTFLAEYLGKIYQSSNINQTMNVVGGTCVISDTINFPTGVCLDNINSKFYYTGSKDKSVLVFGYSTVHGAVSTTHMGVYNIAIENDTDMPTWDNDDFIGVEFRNIKNSTITIIQSDYFNIGVATIPHNSGFQQNNVFLYSIKKSKYYVKLSNRTVAGFPGVGFSNENNFYGGDFWAISASFNSGQDRYGIYITSEDGNYPNNNNNTFYKPCFQLGGSSTTDPYQKIPLYAEHGYLNRIYDARVETPTLTYHLQENDAHSNHFSCGWSYIGGLRPKSISTGIYMSSPIVNQRYQDTLGQKTFIWQSKFLSKRLNLYNNSGTVYAQDELFFLTNSGKDKIATNDTGVAGNTITINDKSVTIGSNRALCINLDTSYDKRFYVSREVIGTIGGRLIIKCFDEQGDEIPYTTEGLVKSSPLFIVGTTTNFQGAITINYQSGGDPSPTVGVDNLKNIGFEVSEIVKSIYIGVAGYFTGTPVNIKSFQIASDYGDAHVINNYNYREGAFAVSPPNTGVYAAGDRIYAIGGLNNSGPVGWVYSGNSWFPFGQSGYNSVSVVGSNDIDFNNANYRFKTYSSNNTMTFSNILEGKDVNLSITNASTSNDIDITFTGATFNDGSNIINIPADQTVLVRFVVINSKILGV